MDIFSHAVAGATAGACFGHPLLGAVVATIPDLAIFGKRRTLPPMLYRVGHSLLFTFALTLLALLFFGAAVGLTVGAALLSHLLLDIPTHGKEWSPMLLWPSRATLGTFEEWEFFNRSWWFGLGLTLIWSIVWMTVWLLQ